KKQAQIGWEAKNRQVDLIIEDPLRGDELLKHMKGWFTADVYKAVEIFKKYGKLKVLDDVDLVIETKDSVQMEELSKELYEMFREEAWVEIILRQKLA
ncbi:MAG: hypothetical protein GY699_06450, partial [Desulfobacteraceae bacterium]|nr:hypothetical protein [Desulfobacteraceae bacterium]